MHAPASRSTRGFTLLELVVVLAVLGIMVSIAIPSFAYLASSTKMKTATSDLHLALLKARSEAVKRNQAVTITPKSGSDWKSGWQITAGTTVLSDQAPLPQVNITMGPSAVTYLSSGRLAGNTSVRFNIAPAPRNPNEAVSSVNHRCVTVQANGSPFLKEKGGC